MPSKALNEFLQQEEAGALMAQARQLLALRRAVEPQIPAPLRKLCQVANFKQGVLLFFAANNAVAAKLRLLSPALLDACLQRGAAVRELKVEVNPGAFAPVAQRSKRAFLSGGAKDALRNLEKKLPEGELRERLRAMSKKP
jgi:hypothetical protein